MRLTVVEDLYEKLLLEMDNFVDQYHFRVLFVYVDDHQFYYHMENYVLKMKESAMIQEQLIQLVIGFLLLRDDDDDGTDKSLPKK